jgi:hypothetical protein
VSVVMACLMSCSVFMLEPYHTPPRPITLTVS